MKYMGAFSIQSSLFVVLSVKKLYICEQESHVRACLVKERSSATSKNRLKLDCIIYIYNG